MARSRKYEIGVGILLVVAAAALGFMALQVGALSGLGDRVEVTTRFVDAAGLQPGAAVSIAGVEIGEVRSMSLDPATRTSAILSLSLDPEARVRKDAVARVRPRSLLGEKYVELDPGTPGAPLAADGDMLRGEGPQVEIDELIAQIAPLLEGIDAEVMREVLAAFGEKLDEDPELVARWLDNVDVTLGNAATASKDLPLVMAEGRRTMAEARDTLGEIEGRAAESKQVLARADAVLADVEAVSDELEPMVADIRALAADGREVAGAMSESTDELQIILSNLSEIDKWELRRLLREEGIVIRLRSAEVDPASDDAYRRRGRVKRGVE